MEPGVNDYPIFRALKERFFVGSPAEQIRFPWIALLIITEKLDGYIKMWFKIDGQQVRINILAKPNAKKSSLVGISEQGLHISLHAKPHQGEANKELIAFLAELFALPKTKIVLLKGEGSRYKQVVVPLTDGVLKFLN